jgi:hypothetical protein
MLAHSPSAPNQDTRPGRKFRLADVLRAGRLDHMHPRTFVLPFVALVIALSSPGQGVFAETDAAQPLELSPRTHDDWMLEASSAAPSLDLSPRTHDDWMLRP